MDGGVIQAVKTNYGIKLLCYILCRMEDCDTASVNVVVAVTWMKASWDDLSIDTVKISVTMPDEMAK